MASGSNDIFIAVHGGAGMHKPSSDRELKHALRRVCTQALELLTNGASALHGVEEALSILEDDPLFNAGYGSNLTIAGEVECDAAIMDARTGDFGSAGAVAGVKNPIRLARAILEHSRKPDVLGRIPPMTLVADGAHAFALRSSAKGLEDNNRKLDIVPPESLVSSRARDQWVKWKRHLEAYEAGLETTDYDTQSYADDKMQDHDTVGAVALDNSAGMAAGVSSGGLLLKSPGRISEAAIFGAGCWAQDHDSSQSPGRQSGIGIACSISGTGEHIVRAALARSIGVALTAPVQDIDVHETLRTVLVDQFWKPCRDRGEPDPSAGVLLLSKEYYVDEIDGSTSGFVPRLWCAFTTPSMAIAYASSKNPKPKALILRRPTKTHGDSPPIFITALAL